MQSFDPIDAYRLCVGVLDANDNDAGALIALANVGECGWLEFKAACEPSPGYPPKGNETQQDFHWHVARGVIAFANTDGGCVLLGVNRSRQPVGLEISDARNRLRDADREAFCLDIMERVVAPTNGWKCGEAGAIQVEGVLPPDLAVPLIVKLGGQEVLALLVPPLPPDVPRICCTVKRENKPARMIVPVREKGDLGRVKNLPQGSKVDEWLRRRRQAPTDYRTLLSRSQALADFANRFDGAMRVVRPLGKSVDSPHATLLEDYHSGVSRISWSLVQSDLLIKRGEEKTLLEKLRSEDRPPRMVCVVGAMFSGKSTLAWQAANQLAADGQVVLHVLPAGSAALWAALPPLARKLARRLYVLVDDFYESPEAVQAALDDEESAAVTILATSRPGSVPPPRPRDNQAARRVESVRMEPLTTENKREFLRKWGKTPAGLDATQRAIYQTAADMHTLVQAVISEEDLRERARKLVTQLLEWENPRHGAREPGIAGGFHVLCFCWQFGVGVPAAVLEKMGTNFYGISRSRRLGDLIERVGGALQPAAHPRFARLLSETLGYDRRKRPDDMLHGIVDSIQPDDEAVGFLGTLLAAVFHSQEPALQALMGEILPLRKDTARAVEQLAADPATIVRCEALHRFFSAQEARAQAVPGAAPDGLAEKKQDCIRRALALEVRTAPDCAALNAILQSATPEEQNAGFSHAMDYLLRHEAPEALWLTTLGLLKRHWRSEKLPEFMRHAYERFPDNPRILASLYAAFNRLEDRSFIEEIHARHLAATPDSPVAATLKLAAWYDRAGDATGARNTLQRCRATYEARDRQTAHHADWKKKFLEWSLQWAEAMLDLGYLGLALKTLAPFRRKNDCFDASVVKAQAVWRLADPKGRRRYSDAEIRQVEEAFAHAESLVGTEPPGRRKYGGFELKHQIRLKNLRGYFYVDTRDGKRALECFSAITDHDKRYLWKYLGEAGAWRLSDLPERWSRIEALLALVLGPDMDALEWNRPRFHRPVALTSVRRIKMEAQVEGHSKCAELAAKIVSLLIDPPYLNSMSAPYYNGDLTEDDIRAGIARALQARTFEMEVIYADRNQGFLKHANFPNNVYCSYDALPRRQQFFQPGDWLRCQIGVKAQPPGFVFHITRAERIRPASK